jgi:hypothetical protein
MDAPLVSRRKCGKQYSSRSPGRVSIARRTRGLRSESLSRQVERPSQRKAGLSPARTAASAISAAPCRLQLGRSAGNSRRASSVDLPIPATSSLVRDTAISSLKGCNHSSAKSRSVGFKRVLISTPSGNPVPGKRPSPVKRSRPMSKVKFVGLDVHAETQQQRQQSTSSTATFSAFLLSEECSDIKSNPLRSFPSAIPY